MNWDTMDGSGLAVDATFTQADITAGKITYTHDDSETSIDAFSFTVKDLADNETDVTTFTFTTAPVNDNNPVFTSSATRSVPENTTAVVTLAATDVDLPAQTVTFSVTGGADQAKFEIVAGELGFQVAPDYEASADADATKTFGYRISAGNTSGAFAISSTTGQITVADSTKLDFETTPQFVLTVEVSDGGPAPARTDTATVTITVTDVDEFNPVFGADDYPATVAENIADTVVIATVSATEGDLTGTVSYAITDGNAVGLFEIDADTGAVSLAAGKTLDAETATSHVLTVTASESDGTGTDTATVSLTLVLAHPWQNPRHWADVNDDGSIGPADVLALINNINALGVRLLPVPPVDADRPPPFLDPTGDDWLKPDDPLKVINHINFHGIRPVSAAGAPEGEASPLGTLELLAVSTVESATAPQAVVVRAAATSGAEAGSRPDSGSASVRPRVECGQFAAARQGRAATSLAGRTRGNCFAVGTAHDRDEFWDGRSLDIDDALSTIATDIAAAWRRYD